MYKAEVIEHEGPWSSKKDVELAKLDWVIGAFLAEGPLCQRFVAAVSVSCSGNSPDRGDPQPDAGQMIRSRAAAWRRGLFRENQPFGQFEALVVDTNQVRSVRYAPVRVGADT